MVISKSSWLELSAYIFIDRKIDSSSAIYLKSRFFNLCDFLEENHLEFNRSAVNIYLQYKKDKGCKNSYLNNILKVCQYIHGFLLQKYGYDSGCEKLTYFKKEHHIYDILTPGECERIYSLEYPYIRLQREKNIKFQTIYMMLTLTGMRIGELLNLKWNDVTEKSILIKDTKTNRDRVIPNNPKLYCKLLAYDKECRNGDNPYVFQGEDHLIMDKVGVRDDLKKRVECLGIKKRVWLHLFRHTFCVEMLRNNDVTLVAKIMGHESLASTLSYTHYLLDDMAQAVMSHPLLREEQPFEVVNKRIRDFVEKVVDKKTNTVHIEERKDTFSICVKRD